MSKAPPLDKAILEKAKVKFIEELRLDIAIIEGFLAPESTVLGEDIAKVFHKIKGASGFLGLTLLESKSSELLRALKEHNPDKKLLVQTLGDWIDTAKDICGKS